MCTPNAALSPPPPCKAAVASVFIVSAALYWLLALYFGERPLDAAAAQAPPSLKAVLAKPALRIPGEVTRLRPF